MFGLNLILPDVWSGNDRLRFEGYD